MNIWKLNTWTIYIDIFVGFLTLKPYKTWYNPAISVSVSILEEFFLASRNKKQKWTNYFFKNPENTSDRTAVWTADIEFLIILNKDR